MATPFTWDGTKTLTQDIQKALKSVEKKHSVTFKISGADRLAEYKYEYSITATKASPYRDNYITHAKEFGLEPEWLDKWFSAQTSRNNWGGFVVVGLDPTDRSKPVVCDRVRKSALSGDLYFFTVEAVKKGVTDHGMFAKIQGEKQAKTEVGATK